MDVSDTDRQALAVAMRRLETPGFAGRITALIGRPAELAARLDERFRRIWTLYLAYCEAGFAERRICDVQLLLAKPQWAAKGGAGARSTAIAVADSA